MKLNSVLFIICIFLNSSILAQNENYLEQYKSGYRGGYIKGFKIQKRSLNFIVVGDWGRQGEYNQKEVANQMANASISIDADYVISTGDNFYPDGVQSILDAKWKTSYEDVYAHHALQIKWYAVLGNHDYRSNPQAQIEYSKISSRWQMPSRYYTKIFLIDNDSTQKVLMVFIDTSPFIKSYYLNEDYVTNISNQDSAVQIKWLDSVLSTNDENVKWKIVVGHHPLYSGGKRINSLDTKDLNFLLKPIFDKNKVDLYFNGHEHHLEYIKPVGSTHYFTSGAGSEVRSVKIFPNDGKFAAESAGFMTFSIDKDSVIMHAIDKKGKIIFNTTVQK